YNPPAWAFEQYLNTPIDEPVIGDWWEDFGDFRDDVDLTASIAKHRPGAIRRARAGYYGSITHIDMQINRLMDALDEARLDDDTYIAFTSDHGEMLGDHHMYRKAVPYEGSARVPFIIKGPSGSGIVAGSAY